MNSSFVIPASAIISSSNLPMLWDGHDAFAFNQDQVAPLLPSRLEAGLNELLDDVTP
jgi:hypothetical protein